MEKISNADMKGASPNQDLKKELRAEISRGRAILHANKALQVSFDAKAAEVERCQIVMLAYHAEINRLRERVSAMAVLLELPFAQCTGVRYEQIQSLTSDLLERFVSINDNKRLSTRTSLFTRRENHILDLIEQGLTSKEMSVKLSLSENTIKTHRKNIRRKQKA